MISINTKKKELIGNLSRNEKIYIENIEVFDHDFPYYANENELPGERYHVPG